MDVNDRKLFIQIIGQLLIADGALTDRERDHLEALMSTLDMSADERKAAMSGISVDSPFEERVRSLSEGARARLLEEAETASAADGETGSAERALIETIRGLL